MLVSEYRAFVKSSDQSPSRPRSEGQTEQEFRSDIAIYGLVGEIGSILSAVKKRLLSEDGRTGLFTPNEEIREELGDVLWYCFLFHQVIDPTDTFNVLVRDITALIDEIGAENDRGSDIRRALGRANRERFLTEAEPFVAQSDMSFGAYQSLAFLTARTDGQTLLEVCMSVLWQLGAELLRSKLPEVELRLNTALPFRPRERVLGEILWHVAALASLFQLSLDDIAEENRKKVSFRKDDGFVTPLHDDDAVEGQRFPRSFDVIFVRIGPNRSRMYLDGKQLGDDLTDNSYIDDGYRFHDVMHLANAAILGWSPVLRGLLGLKRKQNPRTDEVEDGARAKIVEEAVIKAIHSEGERVAEARAGPQLPGQPAPLFSNESEITFQFLKFVHNFTKGLEVFENTYAEWERTILRGHAIFRELRRHGQGTVSINLEDRTISFRPETVLDLRGTVGGMGAALIDSTVEPEQVHRVAAQRAVLAVLGMSGEVALSQIDVEILNHSQVSVRLSGDAQLLAWKRGIIAFRVTFARTGTIISCTALGICDHKS